MADGDAASAGVRKRRARSRSESAVPDEFWGRLEVVLGSEPPPARGRSHVWKWNEEQQKMRIVPKVPPRKRRAPAGKVAAPEEAAAATGGATGAVGGASAAVGGASAAVGGASAGSKKEEVLDSGPPPTP